MICPFCSSSIPEGSLVCPACRAPLDATTKIPKLSEAWCSHCGALLDPGASSCSVCGAPVTYGETSFCKNTQVDAGLPPFSSKDFEMGLARGADAQNAAGRLGARDADKAQKNDTASNSAHNSSVSHSSQSQASAEKRNQPATQLPAFEPQASNDTRDHLPRLKILVTALVFAVIAMSAVVLLITHPWDPTALDTKARTAADTSMAGYPGQVSELQGQDRSRATNSNTQEVKSTEQQSYEDVLALYNQLKTLADKLDANETSFNEMGLTGSLADRTIKRDEAQTLAVEISNLISQVDSLDQSTGTYDEAKTNIKTLGNWLRNRVDALRAAWEKSVLYQDTAGHEDEIKAPLYSQYNVSISQTYKQLFDDNYDAWKPQAPTA